MREQPSLCAIGALELVGHHTGPDWRDLGVLLVWGVAGAFIAVRRFRWNPRPE